VPALTQALVDKNVAVREAAVKALAEIGDASSTSALTQALQDTHSGVRQAAAEALRKIGGTK
jgi:HEAT repeat protein